MKGLFTLLDKDKNEITTLAVNKLPFKKEKVLETSIKKFMDDDPCIIHYTYCTNILGFNMLEDINNRFNNIKELSFAIKDCPDFIKDIADFNDSVKYINII
ncbi:MAG: hypothetical protein K0R54_145 [Clostridiaceae bacterium]|nr:hypothetical protein [Clostridiaceae bacterium]